MALFLLSCGPNFPNMIKEASIFEESGQTEKAIEMYTRIIKEDSFNTEALSKRGWIHSKRKDNEKAGSDFSDAAMAYKIKDKNNSEAGRYYYTAGLHYSLAGMCILADSSYKYACEAGHSESCNKKCVK